MFSGAQRLVQFAACACLIFVSLPDAAPAQTPEIDVLREQANRPDASAEDWRALGTELLVNQLEQDLDFTEAAENPDLIEARNAFQRAAELGDVEALNNLASMVRQGLGGPQDIAEADRLLRDAAAGGSAGAYASLSDAYRNGVDGYEQNPVRAFEYMRAAAETGDTYFQWRFAMMHLRGIGTEPNSEEAYRWLVIASEQGEINAMTSRGVMLATGDGVTEDDVAARYWYQRAAESGMTGFDQALKNLGGMHYTGEGGPQNRPLGYAFIRISAAAGNSEAAALVDRIHDSMSDDEIREAQRLAQAWVEEFILTDDDAE